MISFFRENLSNKLIKQNEIISFEIFGKKEHFQVLSINGPDAQSDPSTSYLITEAFYSSSFLEFKLIKIT